MGNDAVGTYIYCKNILIFYSNGNSILFYISKIYVSSTFSLFPLKDGKCDIMSIWNDTVKSIIFVVTDGNSSHEHLPALSTVPCHLNLPS